MVGTQLATYPLNRARSRHRANHITESIFQPAYLRFQVFKKTTIHRTEVSEDSAHHRTAKETTINPVPICSD